MTGITLDSLSFVTTDFLWAVFAVAVIGWGIYSAILVYHWNRYGYAPRRMQHIKRLYFAVAFILLAVMVVAILSFNV